MEKKYNVGKRSFFYFSKFELCIMSIGIDKNSYKYSEKFK